MPLTDTAIRNLKPAEKPVRAFDSGGLYLEVAPSGGKWWRLKYRFGGKEKRLSLGVYPDVGLKDARDRRDAARKLLVEGVDPGEHRKEQKAAKAERASNSFEAVAREWFGKYSPNWAKSHADKIIGRFERDVFPWIGAKPIAEINAAELLRAIRRIEERGVLETAHRALQNCGQVFRYAVANGLTERDPSGDLRGALPPVKGRHFAAIIDPPGVAKLLHSFDDFKGSYIVLAALRLSPLFFVRPGELRQALWADKSRYVLRPYLATAISVRVAQGVYSGAARRVVWMPRPPGGFACGGSHCVARSRLGNPAPVRPGGAPQGHGCRLASADFWRYV